MSVIIARILNVIYPRIVKSNDTINIVIAARQDTNWISDWLHADTFELVLFANGTEVVRKPVVLTNWVEVTTSIQYKMPNNDVSMEIRLYHTEILHIWGDLVDTATIKLTKGTSTSTPGTDTISKESTTDKLVNWISANVTIVIVVVVIIMLSSILLKRGK